MMSCNRFPYKFYVCLHTCQTDILTHPTASTALELELGFHSFPKQALRPTEMNSMFTVPHSHEQSQKST